MRILLATLLSLTALLHAQEPQLLLCPVGKPLPYLLPALAEDLERDLGVKSEIRDFKVAVGKPSYDERKRWLEELRARIHRLPGVEAAFHQEAKARGLGPKERWEDPAVVDMAR